MLLLLLQSLLSQSDACGGPEYAVLDAPLQPVGNHVNDWLYQWDGYEPHPAPMTRFLYAFRPADPQLYVGADPDGGEEDEGELADRVTPRYEAFQAALKKGDMKAATQAAKEVVQRILDLPANAAEPYGEELRLTVEFLELGALVSRAPKEEVARWFERVNAADPAPNSVFAPIASVRDERPATAKADPKSPRAASLRWLIFRNLMTVGVADGWEVEDIRRKTPPEVFARLQKNADQWLSDFPDHPLADFMRLKKVRLYYLAGESDNAWKILLDIYKTHPARAAAEMRFLTLHQVTPSVVDPRLIPPEVVVGLLDSHPLSSSDWDYLWNRAATEKTASWALRVQEKLLLQAVSMATSGSLPSAFPAAVAAPSPEWAKLRFAALVEAGRKEEARKQLGVLDPKDPLVPPLVSKLYLSEGDWVAAIRTPGLNPDSVRYLIRILAPPDSVLKLVDDSDPLIRWEARLSVGSREIADSGNWTKAARWMDPVDPGRAALWREAGQKAEGKSPEQLLAYARFLRQHGGEIFVGNSYDDKVWYRSLPVRRPPYKTSAAGSSDAWILTEGWLKRSFSSWYALVAYADWLNKLHLESPRNRLIASQTLPEIDELYNILLNYGNQEDFAWSAVLPSSQPAVDIRKAGRILNQK